MRKQTLSVIALVLASAILATLLFSSVVLGPPPEPSPPVDFNVNVQNTPLPVEVTNPTGMPIADRRLSTDYTNAESGEDFAQTTSSSGIFRPIDDETIVFTGGSATGYLVFSCENGVGAVPATGYVEVTAAGASRRFALPLNSLYRVEHVTEIHLGVLVHRPALPGPATWAVSIEATVFYFIEE